MKIEIRNLKIASRHGVYAYEKIEPQNFVVQCSIEMEDRENTSDDISSIFSYEIPRQIIRDILLGESRNTLEYLVNSINTAILPLDDRIISVTTKIEKTEIFDDCIVSVERTKRRY